MPRLDQTAHAGADLARLHGPTAPLSADEPALRLSRIDPTARADGGNADVELAPAAVARVAAFPLARVEGLAEPELAAAARAADPGDMSSWSAYTAAYAEALARARARLRAATGDDPAFMRALTLANPELAASAAATPREPRNKRVRHLETSLYRHLARAVARPEPGGLWAGVALAHFGTGEGLHSAPAAGRCAFAPDLAFFAAVFAALVAGPAYCGRGLYKLNPTLRSRAGGHCFSIPVPGGSLQRREIRPSRALEAALAALRGAEACFTLQAAAGTLGSAGFPAPSVPGLLDLLVERGVLVGGLRFPTRFTDAWQALGLAAADLLPGHRAAWDAATLALRARCERLGEVALSISAGELAGELAAARQVLVDLAAALALTCPPLPRAALRCDLRAPFTVTLGQDLRAMLEGTISDFAAFLVRLGMGGALSPALVERWLGAGGRALAEFEPPPALPYRGGPATWEDLGAELGPELAARAAAWAARLTSGEHDEIRAPAQPDTPVGAAFGSLLFAPGSAAVAGRLVLRGLVRDATPAFARCAALLEPGGGRVTGWLAKQFTRLADARGIDLAELCFHCPSPNVLARPRLVPHRVDLWGADPGALDLRGARVERDPATGAPVCALPGRPRPLAIFSLTAALVPPGDACQHLLLLSSLRTPPQIPRGDRLGFLAELRAGRHSPRVTLPEGQIVRTRRTALAGADLRALQAAAPGAARFAVWQRLAAARGWPALVLVHRDGEPPLLVPRDAPLAVEAMSEGAGRCACITVEEFIDDACISGADGARHVAEFSLPFVRRALLARAGSELAAGQPLARCA